MVPVKGLALETEGDDDGEDRQGNDLLNDLELHKVEGTSVDGRTDAVCGDLKAVFKKGNAPGKENDEDERPAVRDVHFLELEVAVPGEGHADVGTDQKQYAPESIHSQSRKSCLKQFIIIQLPNERQK